MSTVLNGVAAQGAASRSSTVRDFVALTKPRVVALIVLTTAAGFYLGSGSVVDWKRLA